MRIFLVSLFLSLGNTCWGQFAVVNDPDGYVYVRSSPSTGNNVVDTLKNGDMVWSWEPEGNWVALDYGSEHDVKYGYVYKDRIKCISVYARLLVVKKGASTWVFEKDSVTVSISQSRFDSTKNKLGFDRRGGRFLEKINGRSFWGTDGNIPVSQYKAIDIKLGSRQMKIPSSAISDLYVPNLDLTNVFYDGQHDRLYITASNSDAAGSYELVLLVERGKYSRRFITRGF